MRHVSIAFVDNHPIVVDSLVRAFAANEEFHVVATGQSLLDASRISASYQVDVLVLDPTMPGNGFDAIMSIKAAHPTIKIIAFSAALGTDSAVRALEAGARGYVLKTSTIRDLELAINTVLGGEVFLPTNFTSNVIAALRDVNLRKKAAHSIKLSIREEQIVRYLLRGYTNKQIATMLSIQEKTVKGYMTILMQKLHARNRTEAAIAAEKIIVPHLATVPSMLDNANPDSRLVPNAV
jgi:DNA-binding NarL/FixJ family response regulator